jgi:hypothetical protein
MSPPTQRKALYVGTEYLEDLQGMLSEEIRTVIQKEVKKYAKKRSDTMAIAQNKKESETKREMAQRILQQGPNRLRAHSAQLAGPRVLPRGEHTALPLVIMGEGRGGASRWIVGYVQVYTNRNGEWKLMGYYSLQGNPEPFQQETIEPEQDDLARLTGRPGGGLLGAARGAFRDYRKTVRDLMPGGGGGWSDMLSPDGDLSGMIEEKVSKTSSRQSSYSSRQDRMMSNASKMREGSKTSSGRSSMLASIDDDERRSPSGSKEYDAEGIAEVLRTLDDEPTWYVQMRTGQTEADKKNHHFFLSRLAAPVYPKILQKTQNPKEIWLQLQSLAVRNDFLNYGCRARSDIDTIELDKEGRCKLMNNCPAVKQRFNGSGCIKQVLEVKNRYI